MPRTITLGCLWYQRLPRGVDPRATPGICQNRLDKRTLMPMGLGQNFVTNTPTSGAKFGFQKSFPIHDPLYKLSILNEIQ